MFFQVNLESIIMKKLHFLQFILAADLLAKAATCGASHSSNSINHLIAKATVVMYAKMLFACCMCHTAPLIED